MVTLGNIPKDLAQERSERRNEVCVADPTRLGQGFDEDDDVDTLAEWLNCITIMAVDTICLCHLDFLQLLQR